MLTASQVFCLEWDDPDVLTLSMPATQNSSDTGYEIQDIGKPDFLSDIGTNSNSDGLGIAPISNQVGAKLVGRPLNYPNPFFFETGTTIGYLLAIDMDIEIAVYSVFGQLIKRFFVASGLEGAKSGYNRFEMTRFSFDGRELASGVYLYTITSQGILLGKGKLAVKR